MSFQNNSDELVGEKIIEQVGGKISPFENHILKTCASEEWDLRKWLKKVLIRAGFTIYEDSYKTDRVSKDERYSNVHNMLAVRGDPKICLVAHTDVCRDHQGKLYDSDIEYHWMQGKSEPDPGEKRSPLKVQPVIKMVESEGQVRRIIQDKDCRIQVGGDDRLGVAINTWVALNSGYDVALLFATDEEIGLKSARVCDFPQLKDFDLCMEVDRGNHSNQLVIKIGGEILCSYDTAVRLLDVSHRIGLPREVITGAATDIYAMRSRGVIKEAVNLTCGYHNSISAQKDEYIDVQEAKDTMKFVAEVVKDYYLNG
jgi:acetylornithine deacetylase/succinyl-diaminopimelate desuccinylase-like protein